MADLTRSDTMRRRWSRWSTPALLLLFLGSGCAALIYELVWFHVLRLVIGSSSISIAALLVSFMGGMGLGSLMFPRLVPGLSQYAALFIRTRTIVDIAHRWHLGVASVLATCSAVSWSCANWPVSG